MSFWLNDLREIYVPFEGVTVAREQISFVTNVG